MINIARSEFHSDELNCRRTDDGQKVISIAQILPYGPRHTETCLGADSECLDHPPHTRSLISALIVRCQNCRILYNIPTESKGMRRIRRIHTFGVRSKALLRLTWPIYYNGESPLEGTFALDVANIL